MKKICVLTTVLHDKHVLPANIVPTGTEDRVFVSNPLLYSAFLENTLSTLQTVYKPSSEFGKAELCGFEAINPANIGMGNVLPTDHDIFTADLCVTLLQCYMVGCQVQSQSHIITPVLHKFPGETCGTFVVGLARLSPRKKESCKFTRPIIWKQTQNRTQP